MKLPFKRLSYEQRIIIAKLIQLSYTQSAIAKEIGCHKSSISREIKRVKSNYTALNAHHHAVSASLKRRYGKCKILHHPTLGALVIEKLMLRWSPEQIHLFLKKQFPSDKRMQISMESIYFYIYIHAKPELRKLLTEHLRQKRKYRGNVRRGLDKRTTIQDPVSIDERDENVKGRLIPGHWEGDLIIGKDHNSAIATLNERSSRAVIIIPLKKEMLKA